MASSKQNAQLKVFLIVIVALAVLAGGYLLVLQVMGAPEQTGATEQPKEGQVVILEGTYVCLPRTDKAQTKECSPGLRKEDGTYIALDLGEVIGAGGNANLNNGAKITVGGEIVSIEDLSTDQWDVYDTTELMRVFELAR